MPDSVTKPPATSTSEALDSEVVPRFWRNLEERDEISSTTSAANDEFEPDAVNDALPATTVLTRRGFLGLLGGATAALAAAACTSQDRTVVPYTRRPQEIVPGVANYYASTFSEGDRSYSVLVKTREGRPIHVTGNDEDPRLKGKTSLRAIADLLGLYDPDRLRSPQFERRPSDWGEFERQFAALLTEAKRDAKPLLLVTGACNSPSRKSVIAAARAQLPSLEHVVWEPGQADAEPIATRTLFGAPMRTRLLLERATTILSLGADFLHGDDPRAVADFGSQRRPNDPVSEISRLWVLEGTLTLTGANADQRFTVKPSKLAAVAFALASELQRNHGFALPQGVTLDPVAEGFPQQHGISSEAWRALAADLARSREHGVVVAGDGAPVEAHVAAHLLNLMLGSRCIELLPSEPRASLADMVQLVASMEAGRYFGVIFWGVNPAYSFPDGARFASALSKVPHRIWLGQRQDETAALCQWNLPENHWLESWGDFDDAPNLTLQQPAIAPLYDSRQGEDLVLLGLRALGTNPVAADYHTHLRERWQREVYPSGSPVPFEQFMTSVLHDGVLRRDTPVQARPAISADKVGESLRRASEKQAEEGFELVVHASTQLYDGRYANNGWLQELPDPITKNTWGNPVTISVEDAKRLRLENGDLVELAAGETRVSVPVLVQPGQASGVLALALGYGHNSGNVARNVGKNAFVFFTAGGDSPNLRRGVALKKLGGSVRLPLTQRHHRMHGRDIVRSFTLAEFDAEVKKPRKKIQLTTLYPDQQFPDHKWGMVIDLAACTGCSACVIACQSENNIATVGPEQVERGREMHWLRIDSYYEGSEANPRVVHQPMLCQHCDHAPCENVCPVNATNHSSDGLNQMVYNRCVGTRYCANNCPYKVRRYNFFDYTSEKKEPEKLVYNPEVTVRPRGVMEKCTFCVQRIEDARMRAKTEHRKVRDGDVVTACAAACPSGAIVFGDLKDTESRVAKLSGVKRGYRVLEEVGTRPAVTYLAHLHNPGVAGDTSTHGGSHE